VTSKKQLIDGLALVKNLIMELGFSMQHILVDYAWGAPQVSKSHDAKKDKGKKASGDQGSLQGVKGVDHIPISYPLKSSFTFSSMRSTII
jgi:hypothetical protein